MHNLSLCFIVKPNKNCFESTINCVFKNFPFYKNRFHFGPFKCVNKLLFTELDTYKRNVFVSGNERMANTFIVWERLWLCCLQTNPKQKNFDYIVFAIQFRRKSLIQLLVRLLQTKTHFLIQTKTRLLKIYELSTLVWRTPYVIQLSELDVFGCLI